MDEWLPRLEKAAKWVFDHPWKSATGLLAVAFLLTFTVSCVS